MGRGYTERIGRYVAKVAFEWCHLDARVNRRINRELRIREVQIPIVLVRTDETTKIFFQCSVLAFRLLVALSSIRNGQV